MTFQVSGNPVEGLHAMLTYLVCCYVFVELLIGHQYVAPCMLDNKQFSAKIWPIHSYLVTLAEVCPVCNTIRRRVNLYNKLESNVRQRQQTSNGSISG